jgi:hypothetical protein
MIDTCPYDRPTAQNVTSLESLLYFVWEREAIRLGREAGLPREKWTDDPVFRKYKFTNVRRRDDRVSQWIITHLIQPAVEDGDEHLWFTLLIARLINWPPTLTKLIVAGVIPCAPDRFDPARFEAVLEAAKGEQSKVYSGAYMLYPTKMEPGGNKSRAVAKYIIGSAVQHSDAVHEAVWGTCEVGHSVEKIVNALSKCFGISTFVAGQVAADMTYTGLDFTDLYSYAPIGPGSSRGLNYLHGRKPFSAWAQEEFNSELRRLDGLISAQLGIKDMTLHDVQNCMCEFSKYCRAVLGEGKPKTTYKPETEF